MQQRPSFANWTVSYPPTRGPDDIWRLLQGLLLVNWRWDSFIWNLREVLRLLTEAPSEFNYLFLTAVLKARAAYLACKGPFSFCSQQMIMTALGTYGVQFATIYYRLFVKTLRDALGSELGASLVTQGQERLFQLAICEMEERYIEILELICLGPGRENEIHGQDFESWVTGTEIRCGTRVSAVPPPVPVEALVQRSGRYRLVRACADDMVRKIKRGDTTRSYLERAGVWGGPDVDIEKVSRFPKVQGYPTFLYGDMSVQYYLTLTNGAKNTLYVICADRTMRIFQHNGVPPASRPRSIEPAGEESGEGLYAVTFDNGATGIFVIDFRPHKEKEHEHVPEGVCRLPANGAWGRGGVTRDSGSNPQRGVTETGSPSGGSPSGRGAVVLGEGHDRPHGGAGMAADRDAGNVEAEVKIFGDYRVIEIPGRPEISLASKHKARAVLRFICEQLKAAGKDDFYVEEMRDLFNEQFEGQLAGRQWKSDRFREDLFRGREAEFDLLFDELDKAAGHYRVTILGAAHQRARGAKRRGRR